MISECPNCTTQFNVTNEQLALAGGDVRCGKCLEVFSATQRQILKSAPENNKTEESLPPSNRPSITDPKEITREWLAHLLPDGDGSGDDNGTVKFTKKDTLSQFAEDAAHQMAESQTADASDISTDNHEESSASVTSKDDNNFDIEDAIDAERIEPSLHINRSPIDLNQLEATPIAITTGNRFNARRKKHLRKSNLANQLMLFILVLLVLMATHYVTSTMTSTIPKGHFLHVDNTWGKRPTINSLTVASVLTDIRCRLAGCAKPPSKARYKVDQLIIRDHPNQENKLLVDAIIVNASSTTQPFPIFELSFSDIEGTLITRNTFEPNTYLKGEASEMTNMPVNTSIHISMATNDPGEHAVNYSAKLKALNSSL